MYLKERQMRRILQRKLRQSKNKSGTNIKVKVNINIKVSILRHIGEVQASAVTIIHIVISEKLSKFYCDVCDKVVHEICTADSSWSNTTKIWLCDKDK